MGGLAHRLEIETMDPETGAVLLLRRASLVAHDASLEAASSSDIALAKEIATDLGGLPLALDQAGAYIEETQCGLLEYQRLYHLRRAAILSKRGGLTGDHPEPVGTTWSLSFEKVGYSSPVAADLLQLCAFLAPDAISEEIITQGAEHLGNQLQEIAHNPTAFDEAIKVLLAYSLVHRDSATHTLRIHRLVQIVLKDTMDKLTYQLWAERAVQVVAEAFPRVDFTNRWQCERYLPHAQVCAFLIEEGKMISSEIGRLLDQTGCYLRQRGRYSEAEPLLQRALAIYEQVLRRRSKRLTHRFRRAQGKNFHRFGSRLLQTALGPNYLDVASCLNNFALLYQAQCRYAQGELFFQRALAIRERVLGPNHLDVATSLNDSALLYAARGKYVQAKLLAQRALNIRQRVLGFNHLDVATSLNSLAMLCQAQALYAEAISFFQQALTIREHLLGPNHLDVATSLNNLSHAYQNIGRLSQAEALCQRALAIREQVAGFNHPLVAISLNNLAAFYAQKQYTQAEQLLRRALDIQEQTFGTVHRLVSTTLGNLAEVCHAQKRYSQAEQLYQRALSICEETLGPDHPKVGRTLISYASLSARQWQFIKAIKLTIRGVKILLNAVDKLKTISNQEGTTTLSGEDPVN